MPLGHRQATADQPAAQSNLVQDKINQIITPKRGVTIILILIFIITFIFIIVLIFKLLHFPRITVSPWITLQHAAECFEDSYFKLLF